MSAKNAIARPYARAAFAKAREDDSMASWSEFFHQLTLLVHDADMRRLLRAPDIAIDDVLKVIRAVLKPETKGMDNFLVLLARRKRLEHLPAISILYEELRKKEEGMIAVQVQSARPLTDKQQTSLQSRLADYFSAGVIMDTDVDPSLISGVQVRVGDQVWDASARGALQRLARCMAV